MPKLGESPSRVTSSCHGWEEAPAPSWHLAGGPSSIPCGPFFGPLRVSPWRGSCLPKQQGEDGREGGREGGRERKRENKEDAAVSSLA